MTFCRPYEARTYRYTPFETANRQGKGRSRAEANRQVVSGPGTGSVTLNNERRLSLAFPACEKKRTGSSTDCLLTVHPKTRCCSQNRLNTHRTAVIAFAQRRDRFEENVRFVSLAKEARKKAQCE